MRSDKPAPESGISTRQKITGIIFVVIIIFLGWQLYGMFSTGKSPVPHTNFASPAHQPAMVTPQQAQLPQKAQPMTQEEMNAMRMQQETEGRYLAALNELEMLRVSRQIAETNQAIATATLAKVTAEKNILNLLKPASVSPETYAQGLDAGGTGTAPPTTAPATRSTDEVTYSVISVTNLHSKWTAVLGYQGNLYQVGIGDVLPSDQSTVINIDRNGVILEKNGVKKKISLVPII